MKNLLALSLAVLGWLLLSGKIDLPDIPNPQPVPPVPAPVDNEFTTTLQALIPADTEDKAQVQKLATDSTTLKGFYDSWMDKLGAQSLLEWAAFRDAVRVWCIVNQPSDEKLVLTAIAKALQ